MAEEEMAAWSTGDNPAAPSEPGRHRDAAGADAGDAFRTLAAELLTAVRDAGTAMLEAHKQLAADHTGEVADAVERFGRSVDQTQSRVINRYCERGSGLVREAAQAMRGRNWGELAVDVEDFARRRPAWFILAALGTGFAAARLLTVAAERERRTRLPVPLAASPTMATPSPARSEGVL